MSDDREKENKDGDQITNNEKSETTTKEPKTVSFNRDVHVKRFGKPRESRSSSTEYKPPIRKEPFTHLSEEQLIEEANKVLAQAQSVSCTADHPPEKFFSLPHRRKFKEQLDRRNSDDAEEKKPLGRSTSDVSSRKKKERTSLSTLFRKAQRSKSPDTKTATVTSKPVIVKRSKSDVSDLKSNTSLNSNVNVKPIRKRSGSESEEFLKSLRNKKSQLSPIIESSPREDYFKKTPPLDRFVQKKKLSLQTSNKSDNEPSKENKVNPLEKPPRYKGTDTEPKPPARTKRGKSSEKELSPTITDTPKRKTDIKKSLLVDEIDSIKGKDSVEVKARIKDSIRKIEENVYGSRGMIHSSQQPADKPPLTRGHTVGHIVKILKEDQNSLPSKSIISPQNSTNVNQPFSYTKPSLSPDPNLFTRNTSPDRVPSPVNKMMDKGVVYAQVVRDENGSNALGKQTIHKTYSPSRERYGNLSDEDEGLGFEEKRKFGSPPKTDYQYKPRDKQNQKDDFRSFEPPMKPKYREYKLTSIEDFEPTYANEYPVNEDRSRDFIGSTLRGRGDGMDNKNKFVDEPDSKLDLNFNELSHRRQLLESRINARRYDRDRVNNGETITRYIIENDPIYEAEKRMKATEKYVNETAKYYKNTLERGFTETNANEDYKYDSEIRNYNNSPRKIEKDEVDGPISYKGNEMFPPEPEYEPPSLEFNAEKPVLTPNEYTEKKYKVKTRHVTSRHDVTQTGQKYKKDDWFVKKKGHYASNPELNQDDDDEYVNSAYASKNSYHNSLKREKNRDKYYKENYGIRRHDSGDSRDYYTQETSPRRYEMDNRLVDSGIEHDFRKESSGEINRLRRPDSDNDLRDTSIFLANERQHTEDNYPSEQIYANGEFVTRFESKPEYPRKEYIPRESADDGSRLGSKDRYGDKSPSHENVIISSKPPKANKKLSGLEKVKQLFSRDSSKKSKKEKEDVQQKSRTRVLKSPEPEDPGYRRYRDPEPSDDDRRKDYRSSREDIDRYRSSDPRDSDQEKYREEYRYGKDRYRGKETAYREERREERRRHNSSDRDSDSRKNSDLEPSRMIRAKTADPLDSPALAERYRERRRLATPSPTPSPPLRARTEAPTAAGNWFKSLDRLTRKRNKSTKVEKDTSVQDETTLRKQWSKSKPLNSPAKNLRFFGDTDQDSDNRGTLTRNKGKGHSLLRKTISNSSTGIDEIDRTQLTNKSSSLSNLNREVREEARRPYKRNLHNISEIYSNSENESHLGRKSAMKPPMSPYDRRSRSQSSSKTLKANSNDVRRQDRGSSSDVRGSKQELRDGSRHRRRLAAPNSGESSTEGESSHHSQRSVVYLHATTVGDIPDPGALARNRSRDDVSSVNSSNLQVRTTQKTFSLFAPWTPKLYDGQDVHYSQKRRSNSREASRSKEPSLQKKKSYSQATLNRRTPNSRLSNSSTTLNRRPEKNREDSVISSTLSKARPEKKREDSVINSTLSRSRTKQSQSKEVLNRDSDGERISRSFSMPKDKNKKAGWFNLSNKKKPEINTRVR